MACSPAGSTASSLAPPSSAESMSDGSPMPARWRSSISSPRLRHGGFQLLDTQFVTEHLQRFGAIEIPRREYHARLAAALRNEAHFSLALPAASGGDPLVALQSSTPTS